MVSESPSKAVIEPCEDLESHISVTPGLVMSSSGCGAGEKEGQDPQSVCGLSKAER